MGRTSKTNKKSGKSVKVTKTSATPTADPTPPVTGTNTKILCLENRPIGNDRFVFSVGGHEAQVSRYRYTELHTWQLMWIKSFTVKDSRMLWAWLKKAYAHEQVEV